MERLNAPSHQTEAIHKCSRRNDHTAKQESMSTADSQLRHCNEAEHKSREEERPVENKCPQRVNHEKYANAKADPPSDDCALLYVRLQFLHDCPPVFVDERLGALILTLRLFFAVLKLALSLGVVGRYLDLHARPRVERAGKPCCREIVGAARRHE